MKIKAPFPYFGGKSKIAPLIWERFGKVRNYIEPFCGSAAVLLARPDEPGVETVNDADAYISNFWRAVSREPEAVAVYADWPVNEADLQARHRWLVGCEYPEPVVPRRYRWPWLRSIWLAGYRGTNKSYIEAFRERIKSDPDFYDVRIAGWWVWGACCWIGSGWCSPDSMVIKHEFIRRMPNSVRKGVLSKRIQLSGHGVGRGVHRKRVNIGDNVTGKGVHKRPLDGDGPAAARPQLADKYARGRGVHANNAATTCEVRRRWLMQWFETIRDRLRSVRVCCGDWLRVCNSPSVTTRIGVTGILLDPPYPRKTESGQRCDRIYGTDIHGDKSPEKIRDEVLAYCLERGQNTDFRIAVCGYEGDGYEALEKQGWSVVAWKSRGGYGNRTDGQNTNRSRERVWFSPHCIQTHLF